MCHHYPGLKKQANDDPQVVEFSQRLITPDFRGLLIPADCYPMYTVATLRINDVDDWLLENRAWGFLPRGWKPTAKVRTRKSFQRGKINARAETVHTTWPWKFAFSRQRCVMLAEGFYEPFKDGGEARYTLPDHPAFAFAALWDRFEGTDKDGNSEVVESCVLLTTEANALVAVTRSGRPRQPVILADEEAIRRYCSPEVTEHSQLQDLFEPWPDDRMICDRFTQ